MALTETTKQSQCLMVENEPPPTVAKNYVEEAANHLSLCGIIDCLVMNSQKLLVSRKTKSVQGVKTSNCWSMTANAQSDHR